MMRGTPVLPALEMSLPMNRSALLPNLLTLGNGVCGFAAMIKLSKVGYSNGVLVGGENLTFAAYLILLGMILDVFDGKFARTFADLGCPGRVGQYCPRPFYPREPRSNGTRL